MTAALRSIFIAAILLVLAAQSLGIAQDQPSDIGIRKYKPRSTLVVPQHPVPRAKYPVIDIHSHHWGLTPERYAQVVRDMDTLNLRILVNLSGGSGSELRQMLSVIANSPSPDRMVVFANMDYDDINQPGFGARVAARFEADIKAGATGLKIFKDFGLTLKRANGERVHVDDPEFDQIFEACGRLGVPVLIHTGEPAPFFEPVDANNERWLELQVHPERRRPPSDFPTFEALMAERDRLFARHPHTHFIAAHMGFHANDLGRLGALLDRLPNVYTETGAILAELGRQPRAARAFFEKYQDRILFGKDSWAPSEYPYFWRTFETKDEYFDYYRDYHAFWKLYGMDLPDPVLRKLYYGNALRLVPGLPAAAFPALTAAPTVEAPIALNRLPMSLYIVTGGAGFIGSHLAEELERRGERIRVVDSLITGKRSNIAHLRSAEFVEGDLADIEVARRAVTGADYVLHQAAIPSVPRSVKDPLTSNRANIDATLNVLVAAREANVKRVVFAASSSAYGDAATSPKREDMPTAPLSPYALQKLVGEQYMQLFTKLYGLETVSIRYFNVFGPRQDPSSPYSGVISLFATAILDGVAPTICGDGEQTRDFTYVANVVDGVLRACTANTSGDVINVATGGTISINELCRRIAQVAGVDVRPVHVEARLGDVRNSQADITKARRLLGYEPLVSFEDGLAKTIEWYKAQRAEARS